MAGELDGMKVAVLATDGVETAEDVRLARRAMIQFSDAMLQDLSAMSKEELEKFTLGSLRRAVFDGDVRTGSLMSGQTCGQIHEIRPVSEILKDLTDVYF